MNKNNKRNIAKIMLLVVALIVLGISGTYAYFTAIVTGDPVKTSATAGKFDITSSLETTNAINTTKLGLINDTEKATKAQKLTFNIKSSSNTTLDASYNVYLKSIKLSKNLYSEYFKWELVDKDCTSCTPLAEGNFGTLTKPTTGEENAITTVPDIKLNKNSLTLTKTQTKNLEFRIWISNNPDENQIELANGSFEGKLAIEATPISVNQ